ncbi:acyl-CoA dehydrogenase family protein [Brevibacterium sp. JSBI002]|uniref:acyl-CoA dehydrogenase family protein n=1 Tax=Brevibacterium sp. JSBI002 TaxID=2886045 RepID=UPI00222F2E33|nr:acyl-CoA dehydrogenase family protein [Brevibacterium sp. JSBI002]UZD62699.1 acyl-CoA dehydrogenase family protein [Brevibacterium sp. JSBI002]
MNTQHRLDVTGMISAPLGSWRDEPACQDDLRKLVTSNAQTAAKVRALSRFLGLTGTTSHVRQWESLLEVAAIDVAVARMLEPHVDARGILAEAGHDAPDGSTWGVYAAESPAHVLTVGAEGEQTVIDGEKAWCSLAAELSHAIVIAGSDGGSYACAVDLRDPRAQVQPTAWPSVGLQEIPSGSVAFTKTPVTVLGPPNWYLDRTAFAWGGVRVAACWFGAAVGLARNAVRRHSKRSNPSTVGEMLIGQLEAEIFSIRSVFAQAAAAADGSDEYSRARAWTVALTVRNIVYSGVRRIQHLSREIAGPAALTGDVGFAKADADLTVYISQHHGPRDEAALGTELRTKVDHNGF